MTTNDTLDILLRPVCKVHTNKVNKVLEEFNLHSGQPMLLRLLNKQEGIPHSVIAKELMIKPATASAMVKRMEKAGYVIRKRDAEDERISNVYLTDAGRELSLKLRGFQTEMDELVFKGFSGDEKEAMRNYLGRVLENLKD